MLFIRNLRDNKTRSHEFGEWGIFFTVYWIQELFSYDKQLTYKVFKHVLYDRKTYYER